MPANTNASGRITDPPCCWLGASRAPHYNAPVTALSVEVKRRVWSELLESVRGELASMTASQKTTHAGATHEEAKPENSKDTRALEQTYLARGLAVRVAELRAGLKMLEAYAVKAFSGDDAIAITALVRVEKEDESLLDVLLAPFGGGAVLEVDGLRVRVVTPESPLGRALLGRRSGDDTEIGGPGGKRELLVVDLC